MVTHIVGGALGITVLVLSLVFARDGWGVGSGIVYGVSMILLYAVSSTYHGLRCCMGKKVMQVIDHCTIYLLIAGTYTPILLVGLRPEYPVTAWIIFGVEWGCAAAASAFTAIDLKKYGKLSMACYLIMGWAIVAVLPKALAVIGLKGFLWLLAGGAAYTIGAVLYGAGKRKPYMHCVFHVFVVIGSILQAICILVYVL